MVGQIPLPAHYETEELIGRSPLSSLYKGTDTRSGASVAIRIIHAPAWLDESEASVYRSRIVDTLSPLVDVRHPALASFHGVETLGEEVLVVRQFAKGCSLREMLRRNGVLPADITVRLVAELAEAVDALHSANAQHGALTPENLFITSSGSPLITDAGVRLTGRNMPLAGIECRFVPRATAKNDIMALAALAHEAMTGIAPVRRNGTVVASCDLPQDARQALRRALDSGSYKSATAFAQALRPATSTELFQVAWRPAAAVGILGALATMGGSAFSEEKSPNASSSVAVVDARPAPAVTAIKPIPLPEPMLGVDELSEQDRSAVRTAIRQRGASILAHPVVADLFGLAWEQMQAISACLTDAKARVSTMVDAAAQAKSLDTGAGMRGIRQAANGRILSVLDRHQRASWDKLAAEAVAPGEPLL